MKTNSVGLSFLVATLVCTTAAGQWLRPPAGYYAQYPAASAGVVSDLTIRNNLNRAFFEDQLLNSTGMRAQISNGIVTLHGRADNLEDIARAIWHAYKAGAQLVVSQLQISP
jgi:hypothetical protein